MATNLLTINEMTKAFLFARWLANSYDGILNTMDEAWYKDKILYFEKNILSNYMNNGTYDDTFNFLKDGN